MGTTENHDSDITKIVVFDFVRKQQGPMLLLHFIVWRDMSSSSGNVYYKYCHCGTFGKQIAVKNELQLRSLVDLPNTNCSNFNKHFVVLKGDVDVPTSLSCTETLGDTIHSYFPERVLYNHLCPKEKSQENKCLNHFTQFCWNLLSY
jgi:hypothetical protein